MPSSIKCFYSLQAGAGDFVRGFCTLKKSGEGHSLPRVGVKNTLKPIQTFQIYTNTIIKILGSEEIDLKQYDTKYKLDIIFFLIKNPLA